MLFSSESVCCLPITEEYIHHDYTKVVIIQGSIRSQCSTGMGKLSLDLMKRWRF